MSTGPQPCPTVVKDRGAILRVDGFKGFQAPGQGAGPNTFMIAWLALGSQSESNGLTPTELQTLRDQTGVQSIQFGEWLWRGYLTIDWSDYDRIPKIFNWLLELGHKFQTGNRAQVLFDPKADLVFSEALMELKAIHQLKELLQAIPTYPIDTCYLHPWNYDSPEGRSYCAKLRKARGLEPIDLTHPDNYWTWPLFTQ